MLAALLVLHLLHPAVPAAQQPQPQPAAMTDGDMATLHKRLMDKVEGMDRARSGIFNTDITTMVSPYFPAGETPEQATATLRSQELEGLRPYRGKTGPDDGTMFVSRFKLLNDVFIVLHFAYKRGADGSLGLDHMRAYLRSQSM